jgi:ATP-dependent DNA helicase PIF1
VSISVDRPDEEVVDSLPEESLNKMDFPGFPEHKLLLAVGMPIMLLRNLNIPQGLCNGTRLMITRLTKWTIGAKF